MTVTLIIIECKYLNQGYCSDPASYRYLFFIVSVLKTKDDSAAQRATDPRITTNLVHEIPAAPYWPINSVMVRIHSAAANNKKVVIILGTH